MSEPIHQEIIVHASPDRVYRALTDADEFGKVTGFAKTTISPEPGGTFSCFGGMIEGRHVELVPHERIVQAWRVKDWSPGVYSIVRFELRPEGDGARIVFDHAGFPAEHRHHLESGWFENYWEPLKKYLESS